MLTLLYTPIGAQPTPTRGTSAGRATLFHPVIVVGTYSRPESVRCAWNMVINGPGGPGDLSFASFFENTAVPLYAIDYPPLPMAGGGIIASVL